MCAMHVPLVDPHEMVLIAQIADRSLQSRSVMRPNRPHRTQLQLSAPSQHKKAACLLSATPPIPRAEQVSGLRPRESYEYKARALLGSLGPPHQTLSTYVLSSRPPSLLVSALWLPGWQFSPDFPSCEFLI